MSLAGVMSDVFRSAGGQSIPKQLLVSDNVLLAAPRHDQAGIQTASGEGL